MKKCITVVFVICALFSGLLNKVQGQTIQGGISMLEKVPLGLYGVWSVTSIQTYTNDSEYLAPLGIDYWNIYRENDVLTLENPKTGAIASVTLNEVKNNTVKFTRKSLKNNEETIETPTITIEEEDFWGTDKIVVKKYKNDILVKTSVIKFTIMGKKVGGTSTEKLLR